MPDPGEVEQTIAIRARLPRTWPIFFGGHGRLLPIQREAIPPLLDGRDAILAAPTATGKTEAALAPLVERHLGDAPAEIRLLYVVPTRALANDIERRLAGPLADLGVACQVKTGDRPTLPATRRGTLLVTTPESLDSLICRHPKRLAAVRGAVLDELHLLDGTYRGDQLRVLLSRLRAITPKPVQGAALSATLHDPERMGGRYLVRPVVARAGTPRPIRLELRRTLDEAIDLVKASGRRKAIVFGNSRREVEETARRIRDERLWPPQDVYVHHGSIARKDRLDIEAALRERRTGLVVATLTLEIGIDLSDVDAAILLGPPPTPSAFQQRLGRACRRDGEIFGVGVSRDEASDAIFRQYEEFARQGLVEPRPEEPDLSVVCQQILSVLFAARTGVRREDLARHLGVLAPPAVQDRILSHLEEVTWIARKGGRVFPEAPLLDLGEKGTIHSNIPDSRECTVVDETTGRDLGVALVEARVGATVALAGRVWVITRVQGSRLHVRPAAGAHAFALFAAHTNVGAFHYLLPPDLRRGAEDAGGREADAARRSGGPPRPPGPR